MTLVDVFVVICHVPHQESTIEKVFSTFEKAVFYVEKRNIECSTDPNSDCFFDIEQYSIE